MSIELLSLLALLAAIILGSFRPDINAGVISIALAYVLGIYFTAVNAGDISLLFPSNLFLMLVGVTLLSYISHHNGTLEKVSRLSLILSRGDSVFLPFIFFIMTFVVSAIGAGNIAATALIAPFAMSVASRAGISSFLMSTMVCTGANAGTFSPVATTGIISFGLMNKIGIYDEGLLLKIFVYSAAIQSITAAAAYFMFKGYRTKESKELKNYLRSYSPEPFTYKQVITLLSVVILFAGVIFLNVPVGPGAFVISSLLLIFKIGDGEVSIKSLPWNIILLVTGISLLIGLMEKTGGLELASASIAKISNVDSVYSVLALVTGIVSVYSSSSGVVLPAFMPLLPGLIQKLGGGDIIKMIIAVNVGSHLVDVSPLSTLGALCIATVSSGENKKLLFRKLLIWGISMAFAGAVLAYIFLDLI